MQNGFARVRNDLSGPPLLCRHGFCWVRRNHLLPGDNGRAGRRGLEIGSANKIGRENGWLWPRTCSTFLSTCNKNAVLINTLSGFVCVCECVHTGWCLQSVCRVYSLSNLDRADVLSVWRLFWSNETSGLSQEEPCFVCFQVNWWEY